MGIDLETSEALYEELLQLESKVKKKLQVKQKESHLVYRSAAGRGASWDGKQLWGGYVIPTVSHCSPGSSFHTVRPHKHRNLSVW